MSPCEEVDEEGKFPDANWVEIRLERIGESVSRTCGRWNERTICVMIPIVP
jgi:hypothetical protein